MKTWQTYIRDAAIRALDEAADRFGEAGKGGERLVHRLAGQWNKLDDQEKLEFAEIVVAVGSAITIAVATFSEKGTKKDKAKKVAKKAGKEVLKKIAKRK